MPKNKLPRKSTHIDMTAMCDVAFLLLTFFMLATKFKPDEPVIVVTPSSVSETPIPDNTILLTIDKAGKVFFGFDNKKAKQKLIEYMNKDRELGLTPKEMEDFVIGASYGSPLNELKSFLALSSFDKKQYAFKGIPVDTTSANKADNELVYWVQEARSFGQSTGKPPRISIKADSKTPYPSIKAVLDALNENDIDRFNLVTSAEAIPEGSSLYEERQSGGTDG